MPSLCISHSGDSSRSFAIFVTRPISAGLMAVSVLLLERHNLEIEADAQLSQIARRSVSQLSHQFETSGLLLRAVQSAYLIADDITEDGFHSIEQTLRPTRAVPGMVAMAFARRQGGGADRKPRYIYERVVPKAGNESLLGFDVSRQGDGLVALERARDTDRPILSAPVPLRQATSDPRDVLGVVVRLPVYSSGPLPVDVPERRRRELGVLGLSMRVRPLLLSTLSLEAMQRFRVRVFDVTGSGRALLYDSGVAALPGARRFGGTVDFGGRRWALVLQPRGRAYDAGLLWMIGIGGSSMSLLLASLLWSVATTRRRAVQLGRRDLRQRVGRGGPRWLFQTA